jgi:hypothetical protein
MKMGNKKESDWIIEYSKGIYPVITLTDCNGEKTIFDINEIVEKAELKIKSETLEIIKKLIK